MKQGKLTAFTKQLRADLPASGNNVLIHSYFSITSHQLRDFANDDFLQDFQKWYIAEDWEWLTAELAAIKPIQNDLKNLE